MRYLIKIQYDGSKFFGFQRQKGKKTIQGEIEKALMVLNKSEVKIKGAGRTDIGVHAFGQCAHFDLDIDIPSNRLIIALNSIVHPYINIVSCRKVDKDFHARFNVIEKEYVYRIWTGEFNPCIADYYLMYEHVLDIKKIKICSKLFLGAHDFHNFVSGERENYNAIIKKIKIKKEKNFVTITFIGKSFYRYMIRNLVGAILDYNEGKCDINLIKKMINEKSFNYQLRTAQSNGLYLSKIKYDKIKNL